MSEESDLQKLLRLKRYEQPPEGYYDEFLIDFQRRQRMELMRRPAYEVAWERVVEWLDSVRVPAVAYAAILVLGVGVTGVILNNTGGDDDGSRGFAANQPASGSFAAAPVSQPSPTSALPPSYVLETRPVSYEPPFSF